MAIAHPPKVWREIYHLSWCIQKWPWLLAFPKCPLILISTTGLHYHWRISITSSFLWTIASSKLFHSHLTLNLIPKMFSIDSNCWIVWHAIHSQSSVQGLCKTRLKYNTSVIGNWAWLYEIKKASKKYDARYLYIHGYLMNLLITTQRSKCCLIHLIFFHNKLNLVSNTPP